jgi:hypothetical protein
MGDRKKILYCLQYCPDHKHQAMALAMLFADILSCKSPHFDFMFVPRFDAIVDTAVERIISQKFDSVMTYQTKARISGWPKGPNSMAHELYSYFYQNCHTGRPDQWDYAAMMFGESDCVPLSKDWMEKVWTEWYECDWDWPGGTNQHVLGAWQTRDDCGCPITHINGNCVISRDFLTVYPQFKATTFGAWDTTHARAMMEFGRPSKMIFSDYNIGGNDASRKYKGVSDMTKVRHVSPSNPLHAFDLHPVYLHGIKDRRGIEDMRVHMLGGGSCIPIPNRVYSSDNRLARQDKRLDSRWTLR